MSTNRRTSTKPRPHPLEWVALEAFADGREALDSGELAALLGGRTSAYRTIAGHVLDSLEKRGLTWSNDAGQHRPVDDPTEEHPPAPSSPTPGDGFEGLRQVHRCGARPDGPHGAHRTLAAALADVPEPPRDAWRYARPLSELPDVVAGVVTDADQDGRYAYYLVEVVGIRPDGLYDRIRTDPRRR